jgi:hypothetical protein
MTIARQIQNDCLAIVPCGHFSHERGIVKYLAKPLEAFGTFLLSIHESLNPRRIDLTQRAVPPKKFNQIATPRVKRETRTPS